MGDSGGSAAARILLSDAPPLAKAATAAGGSLGVGQAPPKTAEPVPWAMRNVIPLEHIRHTDV